MGLEKISVIRRHLGMSIDELSVKSGVPIGTLSKISAGITKDPKLETVRAIARALGCTIDDFDDDQDSCHHSDTAHRIATLYDRADDHIREIINVALKPYDTTDRFEIADEIVPCDIHKMKPIVGIAAAGNPDPVVEMEPEYIVADDAPSTADVGYRLNGRSMEPRYPHMGIVWVDSRAVVGVGQVGIFIVDGEITCKQLQNDIKGAYLAPLNEKYDVVRINEFTDWKALGRVVS